jgi:hypothetical protein
MEHNEMSVKIEPFLLYSGIPRIHFCDGTLNYVMTSRFASFMVYYSFIILLFDAT